MTPERPSWDESDGEMPDITDSDGVREFFRDLFSSKGFKDDQGITWGVGMFHSDGSFRRIEGKDGQEPDVCPACSGAGIMSHVSESEVLWSMSCPCCGGDGLVTIVPGRKGVA